MFSIHSKSGWSFRTSKTSCYMVWPASMEAWPINLDYSAPHLTFFSFSPQSECLLSVRCLLAAHFSCSLLSEVQLFFIFFLLQFCRTVSVPLRLGREARQTFNDIPSPLQYDLKRAQGERVSTVNQWRLVSRIADRLAMVIHAVILAICYIIFFPSRMQ